RSLECVTECALSGISEGKAQLRNRPGAFTQPLHCKAHAQVQEIRERCDAGNFLEAYGKACSRHSNFLRKFVKPPGPRWFPVHEAQSRRDALVAEGAKPSRCTRSGRLKIGADCLNTQKLGKLV